MIWCDRKHKGCITLAGSSNVNSDASKGDIEGIDSNLSRMSKKLWKELEEKGWSKSGHKHVCPNCKDTISAV